MFEVFSKFSNCCISNCFQLIRFEIISVASLNSLGDKNIIHHSYFFNDILISQTIQRRHTNDLKSYELKTIRNTTI